MTDKPEHHTENGFKNLHLAGDGKKSLWSVMKMRLTSNWADHDRLAGDVPIQKTDPTNLLKPTQPQQVTWIGHSTFLLQINGTNILTDPIFSERASPLSWAGPKRFTQPALGIDELPEIHFIVLSHNHYDHLDLASAEKLGPGPTWLVPLNNSHLLSSVGIDNVIELDWWETHQVGGWKFTATPVQHWSARGLHDRFESLWSGWVIENEATTVYFAGDTGYNAQDFTETGERFGPFDLALIPIGAYLPRWFMKSMHVNPEEAVQIHLDVRSKLSIGMHWGTFPLTAEEPGAPPIQLDEALKAKGLSPTDFVAIPIGATKGWPTD